MTVLLDKPLSERQKWALHYLADRSSYWTTANGYFDCGADFVHAYAVAFSINSADKAQASLQKILRKLAVLRLVEVRSVWQESAGIRGVGIANANEYKATGRGCRAAISTDTYD